MITITERKSSSYTINSIYMKPGDVIEIIDKPSDFTGELLLKMTDHQIVIISGPRAGIVNPSSNYNGRLVDLAISISYQKE